jgi:hypothetical protein
MAVTCYTRELVCPQSAARRTCCVHGLSMGDVIVKRMKLILVSAGIVCLSCLPLCADEATVIEFFRARGESSPLMIMGTLSD